MDSRSGPPVRLVAGDILRRLPREACRESTCQTRGGICRRHTPIGAIRAEHPELNQIMVHEGTAPSDRLTSLIATHIKPFFNGIRPAWQMLRDAGTPRPSTATSSTTYSSARHHCPTSTPPRSACSPAETRRAPPGSTPTLTDWSPFSCRAPPPFSQRCRRAGCRGLSLPLDD